MLDGYDCTVSGVVSITAALGMRETGDRKQRWGWEVGGCWEPDLQNVKTIGRLCYNASEHVHCEQFHKSNCVRTLFSVYNFYIFYLRVVGYF